MLSGFVVATLGFLNLFTWNGKILWFFEGYDPGAGSAGARRAASPFISPDNFANYLAIIFPLMITGAAFRTFLTPKKLEAPFRILCGFGAFMILCSLILSLSRGGWIAAILGVTVLFFLATGPRGRTPETGNRRRLRRFGVAAVGLAIVVAILYVGPRARQHLDVRLTRTLEQTTDLAGRAAIWRDGVGMVQDFPVLGIGMGAWPELFPKYQSPQLPLFWREAHNDYLEFLSETGVIGLIILVWFFWFCFRGIFRAMGSFDRQTIPIIAALVAGISAMALQEFFDFNLQIPANAFLFTVMLAVSLRLAVIGDRSSVLAVGGEAGHRTPDTGNRAMAGHRTPETGHRVAAVVLGGVAAALLLTAFRQERIPYPHNLTATPPTTITQAVNRITSYPAQAEGLLSIRELGIYLEGLFPILTRSQTVALAVVE